MGKISPLKSSPRATELPASGCDDHVHPFEMIVLRTWRSLNLTTPLGVTLLWHGPASHGGVS